jgi:hypothetical protein
MEEKLRKASAGKACLERFYWFSGKAGPIEEREDVMTGWELYSESLVRLFVLAALGWLVY